MFCVNKIALFHKVYFVSMMLDLKDVLALSFIICEPHNGSSSAVSWSSLRSSVPWYGRPGST